MKVFLIRRLMFIPKILLIELQSEVSLLVRTPTSLWSWNVMSCRNKFSNSRVLSLYTNLWFKNPKVIPRKLAVTLKNKEIPNRHLTQWWKRTKKKEQTRNQHCTH